MLKGSIASFSNCKLATIYINEFPRQQSSIPSEKDASRQTRFSGEIC